MAKCLLLVLFLIFSSSISAQEDAWVYFTDKSDVEAALANPLSILTQKALDRKNKHNINIDERDVPVNENYIEQIKQLSDISVLAKSKWMNCIHVRGSQASIESLKQLDFVVKILFANTSLQESSGRFQFMKEDPSHYSSRADYNYGASANQVEMLNLPALHEQDYTGEGMTIAIMDSGFPGVATNGGFERLRAAGKLLNGYDFVDRNENEFEFTQSSHGTQVASTIVGYLPNAYVGTAPDAAIYCFRTEDVASENPVEESYWVEAAERADSLGVDIINTSLGYREFDNPAYDYSYEDMDGVTTFISRGASLASEKGILVVTSAGNSGSGMISAPADARGVFSIGAVDGAGNYASFSSLGPSSDGRIKPDVVAQGVSSSVISASGAVSTSNGTSFSAPIIAGAIASFWQANPSRTPQDVMQLIRESASIFQNPTNQLGFGIPDFEEALPSLLSARENAFAKAYTLYPNPAKEYAVATFPAAGTPKELVIIDLLGKVVGEFSTTDETLVMPISFLKKGIYLIQIIDGKTISNHKLVKY